MRWFKRDRRYNTKETQELPVRQSLRIFKGQAHFYHTGYQAFGRDGAALFRSVCGGHGRAVNGRRKQDLSGATVYVYKSFAVDRGAHQAFGGFLYGKLQEEDQAIAMFPSIFTVSFCTSISSNSSLGTGLSKTAMP